MAAFLQRNAWLVPLVFALLDFWPLRRWRERRALLEKIPLLLLSVAVGCVVILTQQAAGGFTFGERGTNDMKKPAATSTNEYLVTLKAMIWAVMVVPISAPMMMPIDCDSDSSPAEMNPTTRTVVTEEDWMVAVITAPVRTPLKRLLVIRASRFFIRSPARSFRAPVIFSIP